jgi:hypothetical protein
MIERRRNKKMKKNKTRNKKASFWKTFIELKKDEIKDATKWIGLFMLFVLALATILTLIASPLLIWQNNKHPITTILAMIGVWILMNIVGTVLHTKWNIRKSSVKEFTTIGTVILVLLNIFGIIIWLLTPLMKTGGQ